MEGLGCGGGTRGGKCSGSDNIVPCWVWRRDHGVSDWYSDCSSGLGGSCGFGVAELKMLCRHGCHMCGKCHFSLLSGKQRLPAKNARTLKRKSKRYPETQTNL